MVRELAIVQSDDAHDFEKAMNEKIADGWTPYGELRIFLTGKFKRDVWDKEIPIIYYIQAMTK